MGGEGRERIMFRAEGEAGHGRGEGWVMRRDGDGDNGYGYGIYSWVGQGSIGWEV